MYLQGSMASLHVVGFAVLIIQDRGKYTADAGHAFDAGDRGLRDIEDGGDTRLTPDGGVEDYTDEGPDRAAVRR